MSLNFSVFYYNRVYDVPVMLNVRGAESSCERDGELRHMAKDPGKRCPAVKAKSLAASLDHESTSRYIGKGDGDIQHVHAIHP
jgi:hypothetical protein